MKKKPTSGFAIILSSVDSKASWISSVDSKRPFSSLGFRLLSSVDSKILFSSYC